MKQMKLLAIAVAAVLLAGCAPGAVNLDANLRANSERHSEFVMGESTGRSANESQYAAQLKTEVGKLLSQDFSPGANGLVVNLEILYVKQGDRFDRWFWGPLADSDSEGKIVVRAEFQNSGGDVLGRATATGKIVVGAFGGSFDEAISSAARQIHRAAVQQFKR